MRQKSRRHQLRRSVMHLVKARQRSRFFSMESSNA
jgi:hypothetical protein